MSTISSGSRSQLRPLAAVLGVGLACFLAIASQVRTTPYFQDESGWVTAGRYYTDLLAHGNLSPVAWDGDDLNLWGRMNPPLGKFAVGIPLRLAGAPPWFGFYDFTQSDSVNGAAGKIPPDSVLVPARLGIACFAALSCVFLYLLGSKLGGPWCGVLAAGFLLVNRLFMTLSTQAMIDAPLSTLLLATCLSVLLLLDGNGSWGTRAALLSGGLAGLAGLVKMNGVLIGVALVFAVLAVRASQSGWRQAFTLAAISFVTAVGVSVLLNPSDWPQISQIHPAEVRAEVLSARVSSGNPAAWYATLKRGPHPQLANLARPLRFPLLFVRWKQFMDGQARDHPEWRFQGHKLPVQAFELFVHYASFPGQWLLVCVGLVILLHRVTASNPGAANDAAFVVLAFFAINYAIIMAFQNLDWGRYYLPTVIGYQIPAALATVSVAKWIWEQALPRKNY